MDDIIQTQPAATPVIHALRNIGYKAQTAIADIIDNSIDANATSLDLQFEYEDGDGYILIKDNGIGMNDAELQQAMTIGSKDPRDTRNKNELGRFGMGLKTASFSLGKRLSVISKKNGIISERCWDLDLVSKHNKWYLYKKIPGVILDKLPTIAEDSGTIVYIDKLDRFSKAGTSSHLKKNSYFAKIKRIRDYLELVYHLLLNDNLTITINNNQLNGRDPFLLDMPKSIHEKIIEGEKQAFRVNGKRVIVRPYVLPHPSNYNSTEFAQAGGIKGWREQQGFYIYRENRLVTFGDWLGLFKKESIYDLVRIRVDFFNASDDDWKIDIKKSSISIPEEAKENLESIGRYYRQLSQDIMLYRTKRTSGSRTKRTIGTLNTWELDNDNNHGKYVLNRLHPILNEILVNIDDETKKQLKLYLNLIELGSPMNLFEMEHLIQREEESLDLKLKNLLVLISEELLKKNPDMPLDELVESLMLFPQFESIGRITLEKIIVKDVINDNNARNR
ncbi:Histidine kinase-, DNA gyrase B-, and HSP90-like ATPase [Bacillus wiedmannii]|uniref:Histidine kinase-, DNA gyrase B-, and HSP90-like ATPase n=1 Tax=Bacillus wiedmannii TaxID=1890302 RepID=A0A1G6W9K2_9BACI|nr:ATP-binding protein [Bacillus wiedmannii]SDD61735.1 Histidine kinase-, DNA gyrase B-, and HSP90-like ATPase [Bacillus wiedmannii]